MVSFLWNRLYSRAGFALAVCWWTFPGSALALDPNELARLLAPDAEANDRFGFSVALDGDTALIGAPRDDDTEGRESGSVYVFVRSAAGWSFETKLVSEPALDRSRFGASIALDGNTALVGAPGSESAFVFTRTAGVWAQQARLAGEDETFELGSDVAVSGDTALVGALFSDAAYVFTRAGGTWTQQAKLVVTDADPGLFGSPVALSGQTALIGARFNAGNGQGSGAAYVFVRSGVTWTAEAKLFPGDGRMDDAFGAALDLESNIALVGAPARDEAGIDSGAAYVFARTGSVWTQQMKLVPNDGAEGDLFAEAAELSGNLALLGAGWDDDSGLDSGSAYVFMRSGLAWTQEAKLLAADGGAQDGFSASVALEGGTALIGTPDDGDLLGAGSVSVFSLGEIEVPPVPVVRDLYFSPSRTLRAGPLVVEREDIVRFNRTTGAFSVFFDGSDLGLGYENIDAFDLAPDGSLVLSFSSLVFLPGVGFVGDGDVVRFVPTSMGATTSGTFQPFFRGGLRGLGNAGIDAVSLQGGFFVSTDATVVADGVEIHDEDIAQFDAATGAYRLLFDGSDVGLLYQNLDGFQVEADGSILMSFDALALVPGIGLVEDEDIVRFRPTSTGPNTAGSFERFFDGDGSGLLGWGTDIDAFALRD